MPYRTADHAPAPEGRRVPVPDPAGKKQGPGPSTLALNEIAVDGLPTGDMAAKSDLDLYPGYRSDVLIQAPRGFSGEYDLVDLQAPAGTGDDGSPESLSLVRRILIAGKPKPMELPRPADLARYRKARATPRPSDGSEDSVCELCNR